MKISTIVAITEPIEMIGMIGLPVNRLINFPNTVLLYSLSIRFLILRGLIEPTPIEISEDPTKIVMAIVINDWILCSPDKF